MLVEQAIGGLPDSGKVAFGVTATVATGIVTYGLYKQNIKPHDLIAREDPNALVEKLKKTPDLKKITFENLPN
jgi:hypothetical protein